MKLETVQSVVALGLAVHLGATLGLAASPAIGTMVANGTFRVDNATVRGNATLFEGSTLETAQSGTAVELNSGARVLLGTSSKGRLFGDRLVLEKGEGSLERAAGFHMEAIGLTIQPETGGSAGRVLLASAHRVQVKAVSGSLRVLNSRGVLVANIATGSTLEFEPQGQSESAARVTGCLANHSGRLMLTDETTNVTVEVAGQNVAKEIGNRVELTGVLDASATPASEASQFVRVARVTRISKGCTERSSAAAAAGLGGVAGAGPVAGAGTGTATILGISATTIAIVGGVAAAATLGGLAAAEKLPGQGSASVSR